MLNIIAMVVIIATILLSKNKFIPVTVLAYYCGYFIIEYGLFGQIDDTGVISWLSFGGASLYYLLFASVELLIIIALCCNTNKHFSVGIIYAVAVFTSMIFNATQAISMTIESNWFVNIYSIRQQIAIPLDIIFAIIGSDNFVSRKFYITLDNSSDVNNAGNRNNSN